MRCAIRNKKPIAYARFDEAQPDTKIDDLGYPMYSNEYSIEYGELVRCKLYVGNPKGKIGIQPYGADEDYDRLILTDKPELMSLTPGSVFWVDKSPVETTDGVKCGAKRYSAYDYTVKRVSPYLNCTAILLEKVNRA